MRFIVGFLALALISLPARAAIRVYVADGEDWTASGHTGCAPGDTSRCCSKPSAAWHRYVGMKCVRDGMVEGTEICMPSLEVGVGDNLAPGCVTKPYIAYGVADSFSVPVTGEYTIRMATDVHTFLFFDGQLLAGGEADVMEPLDFPGATIGRRDSTYSSGRSYKSYVNLLEGNHRFEFLHFGYNHESRATMYWQPPGASSQTVVPAEVFGAPCPSAPAVSSLEVRLDGKAVTGDTTVLASAGARLSVKAAVDNQPQSPPLIYRYTFDYVNGSIDTNLSQVEIVLDSARIGDVVPQVKAIYDGCRGTNTKYFDFTITVEAPTAVRQWSASGGKALPRPEGDALLVDNLGADPVDIAFYDLSGRRVCRVRIDGGENGRRVGLDRLPDGVYVARTVMSGERVGLVRLFRK